MSFQGPSTFEAKTVPPRRKRREEKRTLNYLSCSNCRKAKVKCYPLNGSDSALPCKRCGQRRIQCSGPHRKGDARSDTYHMDHTAITDGAPYDGRSSSRPALTGVSEPENEQQAHDSLLLLSLHYMITLAINEARSLCEEIVKPMKHDVAWNIYAEALDDKIKTLWELAESLRNKAMKFSRIPEVIISATTDVAYSSEILGLSVENKAYEEVNRRIDRYEELGYHGIAYIMQIKRILAYPNLLSEEAHRLIRCRSGLLSDIKTATKQSALRLAIPDICFNSQLFIPAQMLKESSIMEDVSNLGWEDCLGRTVCHIMYDAGLQDTIVWSQEGFDEQDTLGRSALHLAACSGNDDLVNQIRQSNACTSARGWHPLNPLQIAASRGYTAICRKIYDSIYPRLRRSAEVPNPEMDLFRRHHVSWAASCGHEDTVQFFLLNDPLSRIGLRDIFGDTTMVIASRFGHTDVCRCLLPYGNYDCPNHLGRTAFWYAVQGAHYDIMEMLVSSNMVQLNRKDIKGNTPLAVAVMVNLPAAVRFLVSLNLENLRVDLNSVDNDGKTPLIHALELGHIECAKELLANTFFAKRQEELTKARNLAQTRGEMEMVADLDHFMFHLDTELDP